MSESPAKIYLIAGATRGLGLALVADIVAKDPSAIVYAGARDPSAPGASKLKELAGKYPGRIDVVKYVSGDKDGNNAIAKSIGENHGHVDTVIASAAIAKYQGKTHETPIHEYEEHFSVNVLGPIVLFQSTRELLQASAAPRFVAVSSGAGSIELIPSVPVDGGPYGASKAALNWVARKIHYENPWLVVFPVCPGIVHTDMAQQSIDLDKSGNAAVIKDLWRPAEVAAGMLVELIGVSTREGNGGQFNNIEGGRYAW
ncbi:hypothetical protein BJ912DRAFT_172830 [Pholiota molesta]|nr:hypothetical protein BJ912DRAFT_172830 [Pholiota molesta]